MADSMADLVVKVGANIEGFAEAIESIPEKFMHMLDEVDPVIGAVVTAIVGIGGAAVAAALEYEEAFNTIIAKTGATGKELDGLKESFETVFTSIPGDAKDIADALSTISDRLHLTGEDLTNLATQLGQLSSFSGSDLKSTTDAVTKAFQNWNVATEDQKAKLDLLNAISQETGLSVETLATSMAGVGTQARLSGESFDTVATQVGLLQEKGIDAETMFGAISKAMSTAEKAGIPLSDVTLPNIISTLQDLIARGGDASGAMELLGNKAGPKFYELVKDTPDLLKRISTATVDATNSIQNTYAATDTFGRELSLFGKNFMAAMEPIGSFAVGTGKDFLGWLNKATTGADAIMYALTGQKDELNKLLDAYDKGNPKVAEASKNIDGNKTASEGAAKSADDLGSKLDGLATSAIAASDAHVDLIAKELAAKTNTELLKESVKLLAEADRQHADDLKSLYVPALTDVATAEANVSVARQTLLDADTDLNGAEKVLNDLRAASSKDNAAIKDAEDAVTVARQSAKTANENLAEAQKSLTTSKADDKAITDLLKTAYQSLADAIRTDHIPALMSVAEAEEDVNTARNDTQAAIQKEKDAIQALSDFQHQTGFKDDAVEKQLKADVTDAIADLNGVRVKETQALKDAETVKKTAKALDADILANSKLLNSFLKDNLVGTNKSLADSMKSIEDAKQKQIDSAAAVQAALQRENDLKAEGKVDTDAGRDAIIAAQQARDQYTASTEALNTAEAEAQKNFGLSKDAIVLMTTEVVDAKTQAMVLQAAFGELGMKSAAAFQQTADDAKRAYDAISSSGTASAQEVLQAQIAALKTQADAYTAKGTSVPAAQQIALATLEQQETDFIENSKKRWITLYGEIHSDFTGMWTDLTKDFFEGGDFLGTITSALKHVGESILDTLMKPFTDQIDAVLSSVLAKLTSKIGDWLGDAIGAIIPGAGGVLGTGVGAATGGATLQAGATTLQSGATTLQAAATTLQAAASSLEGAAGSGAAAGAGGAGSGGGASAGGGLTGWISAISGAVTAVASVLQLFGVGEGGQKDRLNNISDATKYLAWAFDEGGLHVAILDTRNDAKFFYDQGFGGWFRGFTEHTSDQLTDAVDQLRDIKGFTKTLAGLVPSADDAATDDTTGKSADGSPLSVLSGSPDQLGKLLDVTVGGFKSVVSTLLEVVNAIHGSGLGEAAPPTTNPNAGVTMPLQPKVEFVNVLGPISTPTVDPFADFEHNMADLLRNEIDLLAATKGVADMLKDGFAVLKAGVGELSSNLLTAAADDFSYLAEMSGSLKASNMSLEAISSNTSALVNSRASGITINIQGNVIGTQDNIQQLSEAFAKELRLQGVFA